MFKLITGILSHGHPVAMSHEYLRPLLLAVVTSQIGRVFVTVSVKCNYFNCTPKSNRRNLKL